LGPNAIDPIVARSRLRKRRKPSPTSEALSKLIDAKTLPHLLRPWRYERRAMSGIAWACRQPQLTAAALLDALAKPDMPKQAIID